MNQENGWQRVKAALVQRALFAAVRNHKQRNAHAAGRKDTKQSIALLQLPQAQRSRLCESCRGKGRCAAFEWMSGSSSARTERRRDSSEKARARRSRTHASSSAQTDTRPRARKQKQKHMCKRMSTRTSIEHRTRWWLQRTPNAEALQVLSQDRRAWLAGVFRYLTNWMLVKG